MSARFDRAGESHRPVHWTAILIIVFLAALPGGAQAPAPAPGAVSAIEVVKKNIQALTRVKENNDAILVKQNSTLTAIDELQKTAEQIRVFARR